MDHTGEKLIIVGGYNVKNGCLNTVDVLSNVNESPKDWYWGEKHSPSLPPENENVRSLFCNFFHFLFNIFFIFCLLFFFLTSLWMCPL